MKIKTIFAALGLTVAAMGVTGTAHADRWDHHDRGDHRHGHRHCWMEWHHHHQVRVCR